MVLVTRNEQTGIGYETPFVLWHDTMQRYIMQQNWIWFSYFKCNLSYKGWVLSSETNSITSLECCESKK